MTLLSNSHSYALSQTGTLHLLTSIFLTRITLKHLEVKGSARLLDQFRHLNDLRNAAIWCVLDHLLESEASELETDSPKQ